MTSDTKPRTIDDLIEIMAALRDPDTGCPWDQVQTFQTIAPYTIEEAYEVDDAIRRNDMESLRDELGDLLLQVVYHARLAEEDNAFDFGDVVNAICEKMVRRHPHVFGDEEMRAGIDTDGLWERIKQQERQAKAGSYGKPEPGLIDGVPAALPALTRSAKIQDKASHAGFDWPDGSAVFAKVKEELEELEAEMDRRDGDPGRLAEEYGDLLFVLTNLGRHMGIDAERSLRDANHKFIRRFKAMEDELNAQGKNSAEVNLATWNALWENIKLTEK